MLGPKYIYEANLADRKTKDLLEIGWLADKEQIEGPATTEVGHNDGIDRHGGKETTPWSFEFLCEERRKQHHTAGLLRPASLSVMSYSNVSIKMGDVL